MVYTITEEEMLQNLRLSIALSYVIAENRFK